MTDTVQGALHGVLVTYNRPGELEFFLEALCLQTHKLDSLTVVDNRPSPESRNAVRSLEAVAPIVTYLPMGENVGPAGGIARGMLQVLTHAEPQDWIVLFDDDDPPEDRSLLSDLISARREAVSRYSRLAGFGASGARFDLTRGRVVRVPDEELGGGIVEVHWIGGNQFPMYHVAAVRQEGPFDEYLFFGFDDLEYGLRLRAAGFTVAVSGSIHRARRAAANRLGLTPSHQLALAPPTWRRYYSLRNLIVLLLRYGSRSAAASLALQVGLFKPLARLPMQPRLALAHLRLNCRAIRDAYARRLGRTVSPDGGGLYDAS